MASVGLFYAPAALLLSWASLKRLHPLPNQSAAGDSWPGMLSPQN